MTNRGEGIEREKNKLTEINYPLTPVPILETTVHGNQELKAKLHPCDRLLWQQQLPGEPAHGITGRPARLRHKHRRQSAAVSLDVLGGPRSVEHPGRAGKENNWSVFH